MIIHVFGGTGQVGRKLTAFLLSRDFVVRSYGSKQVDLLKKPPAKFMQNIKDDDVVLFLSCVPRKVRDNYVTAADNLLMVENFASSLVSRPYVVFFSSVDVVDLNTYYGFGKASAEFLFRMHAKRLGFRLGVVRMPGIYGKGLDSKVKRITEGGGLPVYSDFEVHRVSWHVDDLCSLVLMMVGAGVVGLVDGCARDSGVMRE